MAGKIPKLLDTLFHWQTVSGLEHRQTQRVLFFARRCLMIRRFVTKEHRSSRRSSFSSVIGLFPFLFLCRYRERFIVISLAPGITMAGKEGWGEIVESAVKKKLNSPFSGAAQGDRALKECTYATLQYAPNTHPVVTVGVLFPNPVIIDRRGYVEVSCLFTRRTCSSWTIHPRAPSPYCSYSTYNSSAYPRTKVGSSLGFLYTTLSRSTWSFSG